MIDVDTEVVPPDLEGDEEGDSLPSTYVTVSLIEDDGTHRTANAAVPGDGTDDERIADALVSCLRGVATMRGPGLVAAVLKRLV